MIRRYQSTAGVLTRFVDLLLVSIAWLLSYRLRFDYFQPIYPVAVPKFSTYLALLPVIMALWFGGLHALGVYRFEKVLRRSTEIITLIKSHVFLMLVFTTLTYFITEYRFSRGVLLIFGLLFLFFSILFRILLRKTLRELNYRGILTTRVILVGEGASLSKIESQIHRFPELGLLILKKVPYSECGSLVEAVRLLKPKLLVVSIPKQMDLALNHAISVLKEEMIDMHLMPDFSEWLAWGARVDALDGVPLIQVNETPLFGVQKWLKRSIDFTLSLLGLVVLFPFLLFIALLIKLTSKGPVFYAQERVGLDGKSFQMLKFRSMKTDAEVHTGAVWAKQNDDRRTPIGVFLRRTSIDELPQLWNVLVGHMSLVGPRPERPIFVEQFRSKIPHYMLRHKVKSGITGWAQVNGWRGDTSLEKRIECDLYYIRNWSLTLDVKILFLTLVKGFINKNAY